MKIDRTIRRDSQRGRLRRVGNIHAPQKVASVLSQCSHRENTQAQEQYDLSISWRMFDNLSVGVRKKVFIRVTPVVIEGS
jgi:hypothetical protein